MTPSIAPVRRPAPGPSLAPRGRAPAAASLPAPYDRLLAELATRIPAARLLTDPLRVATYGTDASFYRLLPRIVAIVEDEAEVIHLLAACARHRTPLTFRAAGTSLSGQAISDSVLVVLGEGWSGHTLSADASRIRLQPGILGSEANRLLAPHARKIGPDPASIASAMIGGIAANNASGMCCGTSQNSYRTLAGMRLVLADGAVVDTEDAASVAAFRRSHAALLEGLRAIADEARADPVLEARIRHKYRLKNTTGYGLNALLDFDDPLEVLSHLMIGSEGTLGFISAITLATVPEDPHKASALMLFADLEQACEAVSRIKSAPVDAAELMDRAALRAVEQEPAMPDAARALGPGGAALLVETRAPDPATLADRIAAIEAALAGARFAAPPAFSTDPVACAGWWKLRKGTFPAVGARRAPGTTVVIEDVAFPVPQLARATLDLQRLMHEHGYTEAIIFGHALEGNLHFVFTQDFGRPSEVERYRRFMDAVCELVVGGYDGSLKAEHGTGRNMAPYVEREWGPAAFGLMRRLKALLDPAGLLNPGVILNDDPEAHVRALKDLPAAHPLVDRCTECGFCEPLCPSAGFTATPRQRIAGLREIVRRETAGDADGAARLRADYRYFAVDTCAACGLCATACPNHIETGLLAKALRKAGRGDTARSVADTVGRHFGAVTTGVRLGLAAADLAHAAIGTRAMRALAGTAERVLGTPRWSPSMPRAARGVPAASARRAEAAGGRRIVYFPSCATRTMGPARGEDTDASVPEVAFRVFGRAGFEPATPAGMERLCCGQPFESKGLFEAADAKAAELAAALLEASEGGRLPVVFDTSPCAYRMKRHVTARGIGLEILDLTEFLHDQVLPVLPPRRLPRTVALHAVCTVRKRGLAGKLEAIAAACAAEVVQPPDILCCGWAGEKGFTLPALNDHALRHLPDRIPPGCTTGYATGRTCEIGLSDHAGIPYRSILYLVDEATAADGAAPPVRPAGGAG